jgi:hypothetical protein
VSLYMSRYYSCTQTRDVKKKLGTSVSVMCMCRIGVNLYISRYYSYTQTRDVKKKNPVVRTPANKPSELALGLVDNTASLGFPDCDECICFGPLALWLPSLSSFLMSQPPSCVHCTTNVTCQVSRGVPMRLPTTDVKSAVLCQCNCQLLPRC